MNGIRIFQQGDDRLGHKEKRMLGLLILIALGIVFALAMVCGPLVGQTHRRAIWRRP